MYAGRLIARSRPSAAFTLPKSLLQSHIKPSICLFSIPGLGIKYQIRAMAAVVPKMRFDNPTIFVCDMQEKFAKAIHGFDDVVTTCKKILNFAKAADIPVHSTTQLAAKLGPTVPALAALLPSPPVDKSLFSMLTPPLSSQLPLHAEVALVGIETHICITQTAIDLRDAGHKVYVLADGVSSCNRGEYLLALERLRAEDAVTVTTSESWMYQCLGDAAHPAFKAMMGLVKESMDETKKVMENITAPQPQLAQSKI